MVDTAMMNNSHRNYFFFLRRKFLKPFEAVIHSSDHRNDKEVKKYSYGDTNWKLVK